CGAVRDPVSRHPGGVEQHHQRWRLRCQHRRGLPGVRRRGSEALHQRKAGALKRLDMSNVSEQPLLEALLDSWDRNNTILVNLLHALPQGGLDARAMEGSPSIAELFTHIHFVRLVFVLEDAPEFARKLPEEEWVAERDPGRIAQMLNDSAKVVRDAVKSRVEAGRDMDLHYDHPILLLQHMIWHEGYHHGQIKLALKVAGRPMTDEEAGPVTWDVWMRK